MPQVPKLYRFYPGVPLKELTSFYSVGNHAFPTTPATGGNPAQTHRIAVLSYLPRTLMIYDDFVYNNKYILFIEAMAQITSISWAVQLYLNGVQKPSGNFIKTVDATPCEYNIYFRESVVDAAGFPLFDRMVITCTVVNGADKKTIQLEHNFAKATNVIDLISSTQPSAFAGEPHTFNFMANQLKQYFPDELLKWNGQLIETLPDQNEALLLIVLGVLYYNIQVSSAMNAQLIKSFEWQNFTRNDFVTVINNNTAYTGNFRVGLGMIPLHLLSDVMTDVNAVPDFLNIPNNNVIYAMLSSAPQLVFNALEPNPPDPAHIEQSKTRLMGNHSRLIALFQYAMFPKSAIKLVAILVKFLFEASRKNSCNECKNRTAGFPNVTLAAHKDTPDFIRNILTHYFHGPYNKIEAFASEALKVADLSWSPYTYSLMHNVAPRILKAYFARRIAKKINNDFYELSFEQTDNLQFRNAAGNWVNADGTERVDPANNPIPKPAWDNFLGRDTFLVVETWNCKGKTVRCNIGVPSNTFNLSVNNGNMQVEIGGNYVYDIERNFEDYTALNTNANVLPGTNQALVREYLDVNHGSKFIERIRLRPDTPQNFEAWTNSLSNNSRNLTIKTKLTDNAACFFGNDIQQTYTSGAFLDGLDANDFYNSQLRYVIINRLVYESHHQNNPFNRLAPAGRCIGRIPNRFIANIANDNAAMLPSRKAVYFYMDELGNEHFLCDLQILKPKKRKSGALVYKRNALGSNEATRNQFLANYPQNGNKFYREGNNWVKIDTNAMPPVKPMNDIQNNAGHSRWKYYGSHDNQTTFPADRFDEYDQIVVRGVHSVNAIVSYQIDNDPNEPRVEIVRMPDSMHYSFTVGTTNKLIHYTFFNSERRCAQPGCFAAFMGVLAHLNYNNMQSTGMCFEDATSYPSQEHPNGDSIDTVHRGPLAEKQATVAQFKQWGFTKIISGSAPQFSNDGADAYNGAHNDHLHAGNFDPANNVTDII